MKSQKKMSYLAKFRLISDQGLLILHHDESLNYFKAVAHRILLQSIPGSIGDKFVRISKKKMYQMMKALPFRCCLPNIWWNKDWKPRMLWRLPMLSYSWKPLYGSKKSSLAHLFYVLQLPILYWHFQYFHLQECFQG